MEIRLIASVALTVALAGARADVVLDENFSKDPGWEVRGMDGFSDFGWNESLQAVALPGKEAGDGKFVRRNGWDAYLKALAKPVTDRTSFRLKGDLAMSSDTPYARIYFGLFDGDATYAEERNTIYVERSRNPREHYLKIYAVDESGTQKLETKYFGLGKDGASARTVELSYTSSNRTLHWSVDGKSMDELVLPESFHFSARVCGLSNARWSSGATDYVATGQADNILLEFPGD